jgi:hypothetical protein
VLRNRSAEQGAALLWQSGSRNAMRLRLDGSGSEPDIKSTNLKKNHKLQQFATYPNQQKFVS